MAVAGLVARGKIRVAGVAGVAALGGCVLLSACSPVQIGAAAIVGNQRITQSTLDAQVSNLQSASAGYAGQLQLTSAQMPAAVLSWLIRFKIEDRAAASAGISVSQSQIQQGVADVESQAEQDASQAGLSSPQAVLLSAGIAPQMMDDIGKYQAQELAIATKSNGGKLPTTTAEQNAASAELTKTSCDAAKSLDIQVNPQFGRLDYSQYAIVPGTDLLSRTAGTPSPAPTSGLTPAC
jgi:hypothetical protein